MSGTEYLALAPEVAESLPSLILCCMGRQISSAFFRLLRSLESLIRSANRYAGILSAANSFSPWGGFSRQGYAGAGFLATATVGAATFGAINVAVSVIGAETNVLIAARLLISGVDVVVTGGLITGSGSCAADSLGSRYDAGYDSNSSTNLPPNRAQDIPGLPECGTIRFSYGQDV